MSDKCCIILNIYTNFSPQIMNTSLVLIKAHISFIYKPPFYWINMEIIHYDYL